MNLDNARAALVQEARELLANMEQALLAIEREGTSAESVNAIFRTAHTIKGSAGLFALDSVVEFTHVMESLLDQVRNNRLAIGPNLSSLLLECGDYLGRLMDGVEANTERMEPDPTLRQQLVDRLLDYLDSVQPLSARAHPTRAIPSMAATHNAPADDERARLEVLDGQRVSSDHWHISLRLSPDVLRNGIDPLSSIRFLSKLGRIVYLHSMTDSLPEASQMDPETCYLGFEIDFESSASKQTIENVFEFIRDDSQVRILPPNSLIAHYIELIAALPEPANLLGEILMQGGALTPTELNQILKKQRASPGPATPIGTLLVQENIVHPPVVAAALAKQKQHQETRIHEQKIIRVEAGKLDALINLVGELVIASAAARLAARQVEDGRVDETSVAVSDLVERIRDFTLNLRMVPIGEVFQRFPRVVRDVAKELDKKVELVITGAETELDKSMVEKLSDPLIHIVRNALDHGIEAVGERLQVGKPDAGILRLHAYHESGSIVIQVSDDGRGLNRDRILAKAIERGLVAADAVLSDSEIFGLIFEPGFSTAAEVTSLSGRGVGMDVVRRNIESLRGEVEVHSQPGHGTTLRIRLPLTLAIIDGFQVAVQDAVYVLPLEMVQECADLVANDVYRNIVNLRGEPLPFIRLRELFAIDSPAPSRESLVVVQYGSQRVGLVVDQLIGELQAVIKPLGHLFEHVQGLSGSTILGNGQVALILDVPSLAQRVSTLQSEATQHNSNRTLSSTH